MDKIQNALIIFIRRPIPGKVKTRLARAIGEEKALAVYKKLLGHTCEVAKAVNCDRYLYYSDEIDIADNWDNNLFEKKLQTEGTLGDKMRTAFDQVFTTGYEKILIIGSDCYELSAAIITKAFLLLDNADVVAGPASDGGYYLLGMKKFHPELFDLEHWSTDTVLAQTLALCEKHALEYAFLQVLNDVDEEKDINFTF